MCALLESAFVPWMSAQHMQLSSNEMADVSKRESSADKKKFNVTANERARTRLFQQYKIIMGRCLLVRQFQLSSNIQIACISKCNESYVIFSSRFLSFSLDTVELTNHDLRVRSAHAEYRFRLIECDISHACPNVCNSFIKFEK